MGRILAILAAVLCLGSMPGLPALAALAPEPREEPVLITADSLEYDQVNGVVKASGNVEVSRRVQAGIEGLTPPGERVLLADKVIYYEKKGLIDARGHVALIEPTGEVVFADAVKVTDDLKNATIKDLRARMSDDSRLAAVGARRESGIKTEMRKGVYTPCEQCKEDPSAPPLWQVRASKVVHDQRTHDMEYYDAFLDVYGIPIFYTPYLSHPDPTVKQRSGLLPPTYGSSSDLGFLIGIPYYWGIDQSEDLVLRPIFTQKQGPVFSTEYRNRLAHGEMNFSGSVTQADFTNSSGETKDNVVRGHIFGKGRFDMGDMWRGGFDIARTSDDTYLSRYNFPAPNVLTSRGFMEGFDHRNYADINVYAFQGLRPTDDADTTPLVAPLMGYNYFGMPLEHGSYITFDSNVMSLTRIEGANSHRLSLLGGWHLPFTGDNGDVFEVTASTQADIYYATNVPDPNLAPGSTFNGVTGRFFPQFKFLWRYPLVRAYKTQRQLIEPVAALVAGPSGSNPGSIPNEDSLSVEYDDTNLFELNRFPGVDQVDSGQRIDYGLNSGLYGENGGSITAFLGESYRFNDESPFLVGSGLEDQLSDFVGRVRITPRRTLDILYRFRLDKDTLRPRRNEVAMSAGPPAFNVSGNYIKLDAESANGGFDRREELVARVRSRLTDYWQIIGVTRQDLANGINLQYRIGLTYEDECFIMDASFIHKAFRDREIQPSDTFLVRFVFKRLGEIKT